ncbi:hypothetical protein H6G54_08950 [Anabaena cylindrica FACHB-243]|uniref:Outer membrane protein beta-barrel domain-containing protein n=1 Tax=Anabaena cylindrica (strain ATCC 27899 / PCC 7122) TaxID=272123 RepID=K9ZNI6_ANACC|nr:MULTISPECIES: hypothetical protein [Anabaena]AFZ60112.1 hypothetical protein Anacy_4767 [Anabaena cylindrica PCC 7122]MBD2417832.1 hypothetical protein [Anabaena cylindrica FACHB-243]MBY5283747.1 hypothetical protein [Anabaena sp. CCAP 1446/1C]MBY5307975.1 hypothetical protein [Anabaena sp. CCAP 1446/1C]MCM2404747.1 hypothetical protein [Anabaena sp. CCAP 1446/1C]
MKHFKYLVSILGTGAVLSLSINTQPVKAQVAYGSYVGIGPTIGLSDGTQIGGVLAFRYKLLETPVSFRAQALIGQGTAIVPTVSYDIPLNWQTDAYLGAGMVLTSGNEASPVGNKISFALQPGIDYVVPNSNTVIFGNAIIAFDAYRNGGGTALSLQGGVGLRF